ncbi:MAG: hypothetical protein A3B37_02090 [Candidatus Sungbacteria bacterium RIFCSPLOWO2_01_FULL_59_16]|uniref:Uncharacterized protein n=1 Tax=Candidatus Sungbacteria bacterium RIFCSPLOWO2_01_FULL_59_16 TaxID=1802280 RepID=A0A1G2LCZ1_9BACT|nr:MAG: hypothetical protein A3B37_02090 [Candidatus Sungbacteria bacterium RIFCSPLOWO2_01_FULL_59_16]
MPAPTLTYAQALLELSRERKLKPAAMRNFIALLRREKRTSWLPEILRRFETLLRRERGIRKIEVLAARRELQSVVKKARREFGRRAEIAFAVDPALIGGAVCTIDDEIVIDASVKTQLDRMFAVHS